MGKHTELVEQAKGKKVDAEAGKCFECQNRFTPTGQSRSTFSCGMNSGLFTRLLRGIVDYMKDSVLVNRYQE